MSELFNEIDRELRQERLDKLWAKFGRFMVLISVVVVVATIVVVLWQNSSKKHAEEKTAELLSGLDRMQIEDFKGAIPIFEGLSQDTKSPYYGIAMLRKAESQLRLGENKEAEKTYSQLAASDSEFSGIAKLHGKVENVSPNSTFRYTLLEYKAWQKLEEGKKEEAVAVFSDLVADENTPKSIAERAREVLRSLSPANLTKIDTN